jgi:hypothetical protein
MKLGGREQVSLYEVYKSCFPFLSFEKFKLARARHRSQIHLLKRLSFTIKGRFTLISNLYTSISLHSSEPRQNLAFSTMSDLTIVVEDAQPVWPQYRKLPIELLLQIIKIYMGEYPLLKPNTVVAIKRFDIVNRMDCFNRIRRVSKLFNALVMEVFYSSHEFLFKAHGNFSLVPALPPIQFRHFLRRIQLHITFVDYFYIINPGKGKCNATGCAVTSLDQLMVHCPGARILRSLTDVTTGSPGLVHLGLHIMAEFRHGEKAALAIIEEAAFTVRARNAFIIVLKPVSPAMAIEPAPFPELCDLIAVEAVE